MNVLAISCYFHDAAATLVIDGTVIAAVEEERFTRRKHDNRFPELSIKYCLREAGIKATDLDFICFYEKPLLKLERMFASAARWSDRSNDIISTSSQYTWMKSFIYILSNYRYIFLEHSEFGLQKLLIFPSMILKFT